MYQDSNRTCRTIVLLIKPFVWGCSRRRRRRRLLKLPLIETADLLTSLDVKYSGAHPVMHLKTRTAKRK